MVEIVVVERVVMFVVMLGSKNTREGALFSHGHVACMTGSVRTFHYIFHKGLYLSSFSYEVSGSWRLVTGIFGCIRLMSLGSSSVLWSQELGWM